MRFETAVEIAAPPERVWSTLVAVTRWPEWTKSMDDVTWERGDRLSVGARARIRQPKMPVNVWEVSDVQEGTAFTWWTKSPGVKVVAAHVLEPLGEGRTRVVLSVDLSGPLAGIVGFLTGRQGRRYVQMEADGLKAVCEAPAADPSVAM